jgi:hypothetical protein
LPAVQGKQERGIADFKVSADCRKKVNDVNLRPMKRKKTETGLTRYPARAQAPKATGHESREATKKDKNKFGFQLFFAALRLCAKIGFAFAS